VDDAYNQLVEAHAQDDQAVIKTAQKAHEKAKQELEARTAEAQGAELRARRAEQAVASYMASESQALLDDLEPEAVAARDGLAAAFDAVFNAAQQWGDVAQRASQLVIASGKGNPRENGPGDNPYDPPIRDLRQAVGNGPDVPLPMPHWRHAKFLAGQERAALERQGREQGDRRKPGAEVVA
jgi:hypothetical protein